MLGHDLGGIVAYVYAATYPAAVRRLGILEAPILGVPSATLGTVLASYWHLGSYAHPRLPELLIAGRERAYLAEFFRTYAHVEASEDGALDEYARSLALPGSISGMTGVYRSITAAPPALARLTETRLPMPVWALGGDHSMSAGPCEQFEQLATTVYGGIVEDCGHWIAEEQSAQLVEKLGPLLR